jgi:hypothetical protein
MTHDPRGNLVTAHTDQTPGAGAALLPICFGAGIVALLSLLIGPEDH